MRWPAIVVGLLIAIQLAAAQTQTPAGEPAVRIVSPADGTFVKGPTSLRVEVEPAAATSNVVMFADGKQVCSLARAPFTCDWDAGPDMREHQIRVVVSLAGGGRIVRTALTGVIENLFSSSVDAVEVVASVMNGSRPVRGLPQSAFHISEDDVPQSIVQFSGGDDLPLEVVVAVDNSASVGPFMAVLKQAVREFLGSLSRNDRVTLLGFGNRVVTFARRESDQAARLAALDRMNASGHTVLYDAVLQGLDVLERQSGRRALVVFTDGEDEGSSAVLPTVDRRLRETEVTVFMIGEGRGNNVAALQRVMTRIAEPTGGSAVFEEKPEDLQRAFASIRSELSSQYLLGYVSTNEQRDGSWRRLKIDVDGHGKVRAREGYRAPTER